jgi:hypothetical protein
MTEENEQILVRKQKLALLKERGDTPILTIFFRRILRPHSLIGLLIRRRPNSPSIRDVIFFPQMRPEKNKGPRLKTWA